jgi:hypothetical protein
MATAMAIADGNSNGDGRLQWQWQRQWRQSWQWQRRWRWQWQWQRPQQGQPLQRKGCLFMWRRCAVLLEGRHLVSTPMDTNESACVMGVTLLRVFAPLQGGGFLTAHHGLFFFLHLLFSLLNNPLFAPPHYSGAQEPCQPIDALPPPLLQEPCQPIDNLPQLLLHFLSS